jgi:hypothetical protein
VWRRSSSTSAKLKGATFKQIHASPDKSDELVSSSLNPCLLPSGEEENIPPTTLLDNLIRRHGKNMKKKKTREAVHFWVKIIISVLGRAATRNNERSERKMINGLGDV